MTQAKLETLKDFQEFLGSIYGEKNSSQSFEYLYAFTAQNCAYLARSVEKKSDPQAYFISSFSWICSLGSYLGIDIYDSFYRKFPDCCPYCLERHCICSITNKGAVKYTNLRDARKERANIHQSNIAPIVKKAKDTARVLNSIYPSNRVIWKTHGANYHFSRLFEELGEIYEAYCAYKINGEEYKSAISEEIADCIAWLLSAWDIEYPDVDFSDAFATYYSKDCPVCLKTKCECRDHYSRNKSLHSEKDLQFLLENLTKLSATIESEAARTPSIDEALELITAASEQLKEAKSITSTTDVKLIVQRNDSLLSSAKAILAKTPEIAEKFNSLFTTYETMKNNLPWT